ncbi:MAG: hypothetical protein ABFD98_19135, partial [Syntrophobacteraceae bacterium]
LIKSGAVAMGDMRVIDIVCPLSHNLPLHPNVELHDSLTRAIKLMVSHNLQQIAVFSNNFPIGMVRLKDAFQKIGLSQGDQRPGDGES